MAGRKKTHWKPRAIFLLPNTYISNSYPNKKTQNYLEDKGYGSCKERLDRSWTIDQLVEKVIAHYPQHEAELAKTGIEFAKLKRYSRQIQIQNDEDLVKGSTVADLEKQHGRGILVIRQKTLLRIINVYVPPGTRDQVSLFKKLQRSMNILKATDGCKPTSFKGTGNKKDPCCCKTNYVILGDFNCDRKTLLSCKVMQSVKGEKLQVLDELEKNHHLSQLIEVPTRVEFRKTKGRDAYQTTKSLIDLVFTDNPDAVSSSGVAHIAMSDHYMVYCAYEPDKKDPYKSTPLRTFEEFSQISKSDIDEEVYGMIRDRDRAKERENWNQYVLSKGDIKVAKNENKKARKQQEKALKLK
ncbi:uncharacterized protein LOC129282926 [Lytechinus pictus]|uniref:uncharacterized protein LOC129282926 n=1 Tax=Lytechinus pictus TaxID=7653 RepID=UPI0030BA0939